MDIMKISIQEFAKMINGRDEGYEISRDEENLAKGLGFVVVYGYSDDNTEFVGAIDDEVSTWNGGDIYLDKSGIFEECEDACKYSQAVKKRCKLIKVEWDDSEGKYAWTYKTDIPHATFTTLDEDGNKFCKGIVFDKREL